MNGYRLDDISDIFVLPTFPSFLVDVKTHSSELTDSDVFQDLVLTGDPETPASVERLKSALSIIPANLDRSEWVRILFALKSTRWNSAYDIALEWSQSAPDKFIKRDFDRDWKSEKDKSNGVTVGTVYHMAKSYGWIDPSKVIGSSYWSFPSPIAPDELNTARTSPDCIVKDFLYSDVGCIVAQGGTGKTTLVIMFAIHIVLG